MKKISFVGRRPSGPPSNVDAWVENRDQAAERPREVMKRLTIDVPLGLHRRIKSQCALAELVMADEIRSLLEQRFPPDQKSEAAS